MNKPAYSGLSILELSKRLMYSKTKIWCKSKILIYCFIVYIKTDDINKDIAEDVETRFDTSEYELWIR